jgi:hypothetical protein
VHVADEPQPLEATDHPPRRIGADRCTWRRADLLAGTHWRKSTFADSQQPRKRFAVAAGAEHTMPSSFYILGGRRTVLMTWMTPFDAKTLALITLALLT